MSSHRSLCNFHSHERENIALILRSTALQSNETNVTGPPLPSLHAVHLSFYFLLTLLHLSLPSSLNSWKCYHNSLYICSHFPILILLVWMQYCKMCFVFVYLYFIACTLYVLLSDCLFRPVYSVLSKRYVHVFDQSVLCKMQESNTVNTTSCMQYSLCRMQTRWWIFWRQRRWWIWKESNDGWSQTVIM